MPVQRYLWPPVLSLLLVGLLGSPGANGAEPTCLGLDEHLDPVPLVSVISPEGEPVSIPEPPIPGPGASPESAADVWADPTQDRWVDVFAASPRLRFVSFEPSPFPPEANGAVERFLELFQTGWRREMVGRWLDRSTGYVEMIRGVFRRKGLPDDLAFTAMIESGFNPLAVSRAGAKGLWQFMEQTARRYGLRVDPWVDERLDPIKSTEAAAEYLKDLFAQFGHWFLALAAYNAGEMKVARAVEQTRSDDFWIIARGRWLRTETKEFVPQIHAAAMIAREPERYGFQVTPHKLRAIEVVSVPPSVNLSQLAALAGLAPETLRDLNAELKRGVTPPDGPYALKVPHGSIPAVTDVVKRLATPKSKAAKRPRATAGQPSEVRPLAVVHVVRAGDTLSAIGKRHRLSVRDLVRFNGLSEDARIRPGDQIRLSATVAYSPGAWAR